MENKSFWRRPEGVTGALFLIAMIVGGGILLANAWPAFLAMLSDPAYLAGMLAVLGAVIFTAFDPKMRQLVWYFYKSVMRWLTGIFVKIDPISILKSYIEDLEKTLKKMSGQIGNLRGQMRQLKGIMDANSAEIQKNMSVAEQSKQKGDDKNLALSARKAGRLQDANAKYEVLYERMEVLYRILFKMYENSEILLEDTKDQVTVKEQEYRAIHASHSAIESAMSILKGSPDQRALFDRALEALADDVSDKVGEMERFMATSNNLMASIDLQSGVFEEEGLKMLEKWERESPLLSTSLKEKKTAEKPLDLSKPPKEVLKDENDYTKLFE
jgi:phage shock protein A